MKYYITTPIYYVNAAPHIGHAYTTLVADTVKRFRRMKGDEVYLTTGTDEHGTNVERSAWLAGWEPQQYADRVAATFRQEWDDLGFDYDFFQRTSDPKHAKAVREIFTRCLNNGTIYKGSYTGKYHISDEAFVTDEEAAQADPDKIITITEENYFFRLSGYQDRLLKLYEEHPNFIQPESRRNEVISFVKSGLKDLSISRSALKWGIPLPGDPQHVFYVWFDALTTYMSAIGYGEEGERRKLWEKLWPADVHLVGKEILRFHAVYWPAFLMAAELPLPKRIYAHGWLIFEGGKMSKSKGNIVRARPIDKVVGIEGLRYYLLRDIVFGHDGNFSFDALVERYNSDLANGLGNLASRTLAMIQQYFEGRIPAPPNLMDGDLPALASETIPKTLGHFEAFEFSRGLEAIWALIGAVDKFIVEQKPWVLAKSEASADREKLHTALYQAAEVVRVVTALVYPVMPKAASKIWAQLGQAGSLADFRWNDLQWGGLKAGTQLGKTEAVFPRLDVEESIKKMSELEQDALKEQAAVMGKTADAAAPQQPEKPEKAEEAIAKIGIEDFAKVELRVGIIKSAVKVPKADRLLHLMVDLAEAEPRSIVAGIALAYEPESLIGRKVVVVANLQPRKLRGLESNGMIVAATGPDGKPALVGFHEDAPVGAPPELIIDSHCHLDDSSFDEDRNEVLKRAREAGVDLLLAIGTGNGPPDLEAAIRLAGEHDFVYATVGVHPHDARKATPETYDRLTDLCKQPKVLALGEIGLDYHYDHSPRDTQREVFIRQMEIARKAGKPIVIHTRDAWADTAALLEKHWRPAGLGGIMHCFAGDARQARQALDLGFHISFAGVLTFAKAEELRQIATGLPLDRLLVETDAPYLTPAPFRKIRRNEPCYVVETARKLAEIRRISFEEVVAATTGNFLRLFDLGDQ